MTEKYTELFTQLPKTFTAKEAGDIWSVKVGTAKGRLVIFKKNRLIAIKQVSVASGRGSTPAVYEKISGGYVSTFATSW